MKKQTILLLVLLVSLAMPALAQNKKTEDRIQLAREKYADGLALIAANTLDDWSSLNYASVVRHQNWAAVGPRVDSLQFYYNELRDDEDEPYPDGYALRMVRYTYNIAARPYLEEYIFDDNEKPLFFFTHFEDVLDSTDAFEFEVRYYYDEDGNVIRSIYKLKDENGTMKEITKTSHPEVFKELDESVSPEFKYVKGIFDAIY